MLAQVTDPRKPRGVRHGLIVVLTTAVCRRRWARSFVVIAEWVADLPITVAEHWAPRSAARVSPRSAGSCRTSTPTGSTPPDVHDDDMCGVTVNQVFPANERWHPLLLQAVVGIPDVKVGDSVWWHCDMIRGVDPVTDQKGWGNVMYIPAAPRCLRNETYAASVREAFRAGSSPSDIPAEHHERTACTPLACRSLATACGGLGVFAVPC